MAILSSYLINALDKFCEWVDDGTMPETPPPPPARNEAPPTMKAAYITELGPTDVITYGDLATRTPGPDEVLVHVEAVAVNHVDTFVRSGAYETETPFPFVIGRDAVGTVASAPAGSSFRAGDRVWCNSQGHAGRQGAAAEFVAVPSNRLYRLPETITPERAASAIALAHPGATAHLALFTHGMLQAGETALILGGGGQVGRAAVRLASKAGARVVTTASRRDLATCRDNGAAAALATTAHRIWTLSCATRRAGMSTSSSTPPGPTT